MGIGGAMKQSPSEQLRTLELAADYLNQVRLQLIRCDSVEEQIVSTLERIAQLLGSVQAESDGMLDGSARETLSGVRALATRTQLLLDAAANFHCGAALAGPVVTDSYAPDGTWQTVYPSDQICLNA